MMDLYVDGSFNTKTKDVGWAFVLIKYDEMIYRRYGKLTHPLAQEVRQVSGELASTLYGLKDFFNKHPNENVTIYYDYEGIYRWICDLFIPTEKSWRCNKLITKLYRKHIEDLLIKNDKSLITFVKIKGHSGVKWNEYVDKLAKKGCGVEI